MQSRFHYIDNLRSLALLLGVVFHASLAYGPYFHNIWFTSDPTKHVVFDYIAMWSHLFRMPLFFVIAGFCAALLIAKQEGNGFIKNRLKRVLLPFVIFFPVTVLLIFHAMSWGATIADPLPPLFSVFKEVKEPVISTMHLWFLWNLIQFCTILWLLTKWQNAYRYLLAVVVKPVFICIFLPTVITISMFNQMVPFPAPDKLYPQIWSYGLYGTLFLVGAGFYHYHERLAAYVKQFYTVFLIACVSLVAYFYVLPAPLSLTQVIDAANAGGEIIVDNELLTVLIQSIAIISWSALALLAGYKWLNTHITTSRYFSDASYWVYLIHVPVLMYIQLPLINFDLPAFLKLCIAVFGTMLLGLVSYHFLVRNTPIGQLLNAKKSNARLDASSQTDSPEAIEKP